MFEREGKREECHGVENNQNVLCACTNKPKKAHHSLFLTSTSKQETGFHKTDNQVQSFFNFRISIGHEKDFGRTHVSFEIYAAI